MDSCRRIERSDANGSSSVALSSECGVYWCTDALELQLHRLTHVPAKIRTFGRTSALDFLLLPTVQTFIASARL